jgi:hypothetical protein
MEFTLRFYFAKMTLKRQWMDMKQQLQQQQTRMQVDFRFREMRVQ